jgi:hypothetical protein
MRLMPECWNSFVLETDREVSEHLPFITPQLCGWSLVTTPALALLLQRENVVME